MVRADLLTILTREQRIELAFRVMRMEVMGNMIRQVSLTNEPGFFVYSDLDESNRVVVESPGPLIVTSEVLWIVLLQPP